jgi:hypothetical protein
MAFGILLLVVLLFPVSAQADAIAENQARFGKIDGTVYLLTQGAPEWIDAHEDLPIEAGDEIHAEDDSRAELALAQNVLVVLQPGGDIVADTISSNSGKIHLTDGNFVGRVDAEHAEGFQQWMFESPAAAAVVETAEFAMSADEADGIRIGVLQEDLELQPAEGPDGVPPTIKMKLGQEAWLRRGQPLQILPKFSKRMQPLATLQPDLRKRQARVENTWSPFTVTVRQELRRKFVSAIPKKTSHPKPPRRRHYGKSANGTL